MLEECRSICGGSAVISEPPPRTWVENAIWLPPTLVSGDSGLFYPSGRVVAEGMHHLGIRQPHEPIGPRYAVRSGKDLPRAPTGYHYIYIHNISTHYGHFLIGVLSRLWTLPFAARRHVRLVFNEMRSVEAVFAQPYARDIWTALGLTPEQFVMMPQGAIFDRIEVPGASFEENNHVHEVYSDIMARLGHLLCPEPITPWPDRIVYLTKERLLSGIWRLENENEITRILVSNGVHIVSPEQLDIHSQVRLWKQGGTFIGTAGSAFHTSAFVPNSRIIIINNVPEMWSNQVLIDRVSCNKTLYLHDPEGTVYEGVRGNFSGNLVAKDPVKLAHNILNKAINHRK